MQRAAIERLLPEVFQRAVEPASPLAAVLDVMESQHAPAEEALLGLADVFDPRRTDERFLTMLAHWVDLARLNPQRAGDTDLDWRPQSWPIPAGRLRELIANAAELSQQRGTASGLVRFLEIATGTGPYTLEERVPGEDGMPIPYHVRLIAPRAAQPFEELVERIVEQEKPAYVTWELAWTQP
jgi:phage tail-like protein